MTQQLLLDPGQSVASSPIRRDGDRYYTLLRRAMAPLLAICPEVGGNLLGDPSCGSGAMARFLSPRFQAVYLNDLDPAVEADTHIDAVQAIRQIQHPVDWWISNPPFFAAGDITKACLDTAQRGVAMFIRCTFLECCGPSHLCREGIPCDPRRCLRNGRTWLEKLPPTRLQSVRRFSFTGNGKSDSAPTWWFVWLRGSDGTWQRGTIEVAGADAGQLTLPG